VKNERLREGGVGGAQQVPRQTRCPALDFGQTGERKKHFVFVSLRALMGRPSIIALKINKMAESGHRKRELNLCGFFSVR
jgi:hypothetical protein